MQVLRFSPSNQSAPTSIPLQELDGRRRGSLWRQNRQVVVFVGVQLEPVVQKHASHTGRVVIDRASECLAQDRVDLQALNTNREREWMSATGWKLCPPAPINIPSPCPIHVRFRPETDQSQGIRSSKKAPFKRKASS